MPNDLGPAKYLPASLEEDADPTVAITVQLLALFALLGSLRASPGIVAGVAVPSVVAYWRARIGRQRFRFRAPGHTLRVLSHGGAYDIAMLRGVLAEVFDATGASGLPKPAADWLHGAG